MTSSPDPKSRFSSRVADYVKYRPAYPGQLIAILESAIGLRASDVFADIGSGTGLSAGLFLENGNVVHGIEPNQAMRLAAEEILGVSGRFRSLDVVLAAQAFHWFDRDAVSREWRRILRPDGRVVLVWTERRTEASPFLRAYEQLLVEYSTAYESVRHENVTQETIRTFIPRDYSRHALYNEQVFDLEGLQGRLLSSSYAPAAGHPRHEPMLAELERIFRQHCPDGRAVIEYDTVIHCGKF